MKTLFDDEDEPVITWIDESFAWRPDAGASWREVSIAALRWAMMDAIVPSRPIRTAVNGGRNENTVRRGRTEEVG
jgi:hypothetical protein